MHIHNIKPCLSPQGDFQTLGKEMQKLPRCKTCPQKLVWETEIAIASQFLFLWVSANAMGINEHPINDE